MFEGLERSFRRKIRAASSAAPRVTGIGTPLGSIQLSDPGPANRELMWRFVIFLEGRQVFYNPDYLEVQEAVDRSVHDIRAECTDVLKQLREGEFATVPIHAIRGACQQYHKNATIQFRHFMGARRGSNQNAGFFLALGAFRASVGPQLAHLAHHYDLKIGGELANIQPRRDESP